MKEKILPIPLKVPVLQFLCFFLFIKVINTTTFYD